MRASYHLPYRSHPKISTKKPKAPAWFKSVLIVIFLALSIYTLKLMITPIASVLGKLVEGSTIAISFMTDNRELKNDQGVTNILLAGLDLRSNEKNGGLTDTLIVASFNQKLQTATMLSIPRDLWLKLPGFAAVDNQYGKINSAYALGKEFNYPGGGMEYLNKIIGDKLGIPIHYYARIDFVGFEKAIDAIGGIDVVVDRGFDDFMYPREGYEDAPWAERFDHLHFEAGLQHLDGKTALGFARSRKALGPEGTDFARAKRQQKVIIAFKNKVLSAQTLFNISRLKDLYLSFSDHVGTNIDPAEFPVFYNLGKKFFDQKVATYVLDDSDSDSESALLYHPSEDNYGGAWALIPKGGNFDAIKKFVHQVFYEQYTGPTPSVTS